ncbi:hypothetical protein [Methylomonas methanica]|uniref:Uncharacterized protein n=1 Tax=Methylomonas methanica (strain DSM 25384 / MC09) TaxID=857087 RepID=F9ZV13_METMM|nr:hypothetical protein [Methylomonas methanica]AEF99446.1 hypothetical protein Metme_1010 [Methylomonas methanica MC09]
MDEKALDDELDSILDAGLHDAAEKMGSLGIEYPDWLPERDLQDFERAEQRLIVQYGVEQVKEWLMACQYNASQTGEYLRQISIPPNVKMDISKMHIVLSAIKNGQIKGLPMLVGNEGAKKIIKGNKFSRAGSAKKGKVYEPTASIKIICKKIKSYRFDDVLDFLKNAEACSDIFYSTTNPTGVFFEGVNEEAETFSFTKRGDDPDNQQSKSFGRLRNILSDLKKNS